MSTNGGAAKTSTTEPGGDDDSEQLLRLIEDLTTDVDAVQERVLAEILGRNGESEYLAARCGATADRAAFRAKVPVATYEDMLPYIRRVADGDASPVLTGPAHPVTEFLTSSGTSGGERKLLPTVDDDFDRRLLAFSIFKPVVCQYVSDGGELFKPGSDLSFQLFKSETQTPGGLPARTALTSFFKRYHHLSVPCYDGFQSMYTQMLSGLCRRHDVLRLGAAFAYGLLLAVRFLQQHWEDLAADIDAGELVNPRVTDPAAREAVAAVLRRGPDPELAGFIRAACSAGDWSGIVKRIWPNARFLFAVVTGSMAQYVPALDHFSGGLPIISPAYVSSECFFGINLRPLCDPAEVAYTILPNMGYFEFLPIDDDEDDDTASAAEKLLELARVEDGREYEVVVTTYGGLYRYRVGDVLRVAGFHNAAPRFTFVRRRGVLLSVDVDKTGEAELQRAVDRAAALLLRHRAGVLVDYTSRACSDGVPGHYVVYWELHLSSNAAGSDGAVDDGVLAKCCAEMEEALGSVYRQGRTALGSVGPLEIRVVGPGTFEELMGYAVSRGASVGQYKVPRCVTAPPMIQLLDSRVMSSHLSPKLPHWAPTGSSCGEGKPSV